MNDENRDVGRAIGRLFDDLQELKRRNNPDSQLTVLASAGEQVAVTDTATSTARSGTARKLTPGTNRVGFAEYD